MKKKKAQKKKKLNRWEKIPPQHKKLLHKIVKMIEMLVKLQP